MYICSFTFFMAFSLFISLPYFSFKLLFVTTHQNLLLFNVCIFSFANSYTREINHLI